MDRTLAGRALAAALAYGIAAQWLLVESAVGINLVLLAIGLLALGAFLGRVRSLDPLDLWLPLATILVTAGAALRHGELVVLLDVVTGALLLGASMAAFGGVPVTRSSTAGVVRLGMTVLAWSATGIADLGGAVRRPVAEMTAGFRLPPATAPILRGLLIATPFLLVFIALFSNADAAFARLADDLFDWQLDLGELPIRLSVALGIGWVAAGLLSVAMGGPAIAAARERAATQPADHALTPPPAPQSLGAAALEPVRTFPRLGAIEAATVLVAIDLLFAAFVALQVAYLFGGLDTLAATGLTYSDYARRGFFELVFAIGVAGLIVAGIHAAVEVRTRLVVGSAIALAALNGVVLVSALLRLRLYQEAYGWTELRFYILATIAWLGIGIAAAIVLLATNRMRWLTHALAMSAVAILVVVNLVGPGRFSADQNVARLLDPSLVPADGQTGLDLDYAWDLGFEAVPAVVRALPALPPDDRARALSLLRDARDQLARPDFTTWQALNLARAEARAALVGLPER